MTIEECDFCREFRDDPENTFSKLYGETLPRRTLFRSSRFAVVPSLGQIVDGYLLVLPVNHFVTISDLPSNLIGEFAMLVTEVRRIVTSVYGPCIMFEHGARSASAGGCGIYHAHAHVVPLSGMRDPICQLKASFRHARLPRLTDIPEQSYHLGSYLLCEDSAQSTYLFDAGKLPSQYMRKLLADKLGEPEWDWRLMGQEHRLLSTYNQLVGEFDKLPMLAATVASNAS